MLFKMFFYRGRDERIVFVFTPMTSISIVVRSYVHLLTLPEQTVYTL
jgi:hypothetical protein